MKKEDITKEAKNLKLHSVSNKEPLTYEQLNDVCNQLVIQNNQLKKKCQELESFNAFKRIDYLFQVLDHTNTFSKEFVDYCAKELEDAIRIVEDNQEG